MRVLEPTAELVQNDSSSPSPPRAPPAARRAIASTTIIAGRSPSTGRRGRRRSRPRRGARRPAAPGPAAGPCPRHASRDGSRGPSRCVRGVVVGIRSVRGSARRDPCAADEIAAAAIPGPGRTRILAIADVGATVATTTVRRRCEDEEPCHMEIEGKHVVVTGAASGIGAAMARRFAAEGASGVVVADVQHERARSRSRSEIGDALGGPLRRDRRSADPCARRRGRGSLRAHRPLLLERRDRRARRRRGERRDLAAQHRRQRDGARLRGAHPRAAHDRTGRRLPPADRVGRRAAHPDRRARRTRSPSTRRWRSRNGSRSPTASRGSRSRCSRRRPCAPR